MAKRALSVVPLLIVIGCIVASVAIPPSGRNDDAIEESIALARADVSASKPAKMDWRPLKFLAYDRLYVFGDAATRHGVRRRLGFGWAEGDARIPVGRDESLLALTAGRRVVAWTVVQTKNADFSCLASLASVERRNALLALERGPDGADIVLPALTPRSPVQRRRIARCAALHHVSVPNFPR